MAAIATGAAAGSTDRGGRVGDFGQAGRRRLDRDLAAAGDDAGDGALGLQVHHVDDVAFGAALQRLAANGEMKSDRLVDQGHGLVLLHQIGLWRDRRSSPPGRRAAACAPACRPRGRGGRASLPTSALGRRSITTSEAFDHFIALDAARQHGGFHGLDRGAGEAQLGRRPRTLLLAISKVTSKRLLRESNRVDDRLHRAGVGSFQPHCPARRGRKSG